MSLMLHRAGLLRPSVGSPADTVPNAFEDEDWSIAPGDADADVTIHALPDDGGSAITDIEYRLDGGSWISSGGTSSFTIADLTNDHEYAVELRAVNAVGAGAAGDVKSVTPEGEDEEDWHPSDLSSPPLAIWDPTVSSSLWQDASATTAAGDGDPLGRIGDQSTNGNHAQQSTDTKRPLFDIIDGRPWIVCDGADDGMSFTNVKPAMIAAVFYCTQALNFESLFGQREFTGGNGTNGIRVTGSHSPPAFRTTSVSATGDFCHSTGATKINGASTGVFALNTPTIVTVEAGSAGDQSTEGISVFGLAEVSGRAWKGRYGRMVLLSALPDSEEYASLLAWLAEPYGISL